MTESNTQETLPLEGQKPPCDEIKPHQNDECSAPAVAREEQQHSQEMLQIAPNVDNLEQKLAENVQFLVPPPPPPPLPPPRSAPENEKNEIVCDEPNNNDSKIEQNVVLSGQSRGCDEVDADNTQGVKQHKKDDNATRTDTQNIAVQENVSITHVCDEKTNCANADSGAHNDASHCGQEELKHEILADNFEQQTKQQNQSSNHKHENNQQSQQQQQQQQKQQQQQQVDDILKKQDTAKGVSTGSETAEEEGLSNANTPCLVPLLEEGCAPEQNGNEDGRPTSIHPASLVIDGSQKSRSPSMSPQPQQQQQQAPAQQEQQQQQPQPQPQPQPQTQPQQQQQQTQEVRATQPHEQKSHALNQSWGLWHYCQTRPHQDYLLLLATFDSVEDLIRHFASFKDPHEIPQDNKVIFFRSGYRPQWISYKTSGSLMVEYDKRAPAQVEALARDWRRMVFACAGETLLTNVAGANRSHEVLGCQLFVRAEYVALEVWLYHFDEEALRDSLRRELHEIIGVARGTEIRLVDHNKKKMEKEFQNRNNGSYSGPRRSGGKHSSKYK